MSLKTWSRAREDRAMVCAIALVGDPNGRDLDIAVQSGRMVLDFTPGTPMLLAIGSDRRAEADDTLPSGTEDDTGVVFNARRGCAQDALDTQGLLWGSRLWLLEREKQTEDVRLRAQGYAAECMLALSQARGFDIGTSATWIATNKLLIVAQALNTTLRVPVGVGQTA